MINGFNEWMLKIGNIYYSNNEMMDNAFHRLEEYKEPTPNFLHPHKD
jgi:hypothetical protein